VVRLTYPVGSNSYRRSQLRVPWCLRSAQASPVPHRGIWPARARDRSLGWTGHATCKLSFSVVPAARLTGGQSGCQLRLSSGSRVGSSWPLSKRHLRDPASRLPMSSSDTYLVKSSLFARTNTGFEHASPSKVATWPGQSEPP
jgi:hypothetical protein